jgi:ubiquinone biosynthesis protein COQ4
MSRLTSLKRMFRLIPAFRRGEVPAGDVALYKADALLGRIDRTLAERLGRLDPLIPQIDVQALRGLPVGTFGRAYADFLDRNHLRPFVVSPQVDPELLRRNAHWARYALVHDMFHVLLGYGPDLAGEAGVYAFTLTQRIAPVFWMWLPIAVLVLPLLAPWQVPRMIANVRRGLALGRRLDCILALPLERRFTDDLAALRRELGLVDEPSRRPEHVELHAGSGGEGRSGAKT